MADKEISALTAGTDPKAALFHGVEGANSRKFTGAVIGHQFRGARARMSTDDTAQNYTTTTAIPFDLADFDTDSFWSAGAPTRLTIPAGKGFIYVALTGQVWINLSTADTWKTLVINHYNSAGTILHQVGFVSIQGGNTSFMASAHSGPLPVSDGDYFELGFREESDTSITLEGDQTLQIFLALHVIGMEPV